MLGFLASGRPAGTPQVSLFWSRADRPHRDGAGARTSTPGRPTSAASRRAPTTCSTRSRAGQLLPAAYEDVVMRRRHAGRLVFVGDAGHAMSPQLGQGVNLALLDAHVLARCLETHADVDAALAAYSAAAPRPPALLRLGQPADDAGLPVAPRRCSARRATACCTRSRGSRGCGASSSPRWPERRPACSARSTRATTRLKRRRSCASRSSRLAVEHRRPRGIERAADRRARQAPPRAGRRRRSPAARGGAPRATCAPPPRAPSAPASATVSGASRRSSAHSPDAPSMPPITGASARARVAAATAMSRSRAVNSKPVEARGELAGARVEAAGGQRDEVGPRVVGRQALRALDEVRVDAEARQQLRARSASASRPHSGGRLRLASAAAAARRRAAGR